jgi:hypothetical protein
LLPLGPLIPYHAMLRTDVVPPQPPALFDLSLVGFALDLFLHALTPRIVPPTRLEPNTLDQVHVHDSKRKFNTVKENSGARLVRVVTTDCI